MTKYIYEGPVTEFGKLVCDRWKGETMAPSPNKALSNLKFRYKKENNKTINSRVELLKEYLKEL